MKKSDYIKDFKTELEVVIRGRTERIGSRSEQPAGSLVAEVLERIAPTTISEQGLRRWNTQALRRLQKALSLPRLAPDGFRLSPGSPFMLAKWLEWMIHTGPSSDSQRVAAREAGRLYKIFEDHVFSVPLPEHEGVGYHATAIGAVWLSARYAVMKRHVHPCAKCGRLLVRVPPRHRQTLCNPCIIGTGTPSKMLPVRIMKIWGQARRTMSVRFHRRKRGGLTGVVYDSFKTWQQAAFSDLQRLLSQPGKDLQREIARWHEQWVPPVPRGRASWRRS